MKIEHNHIQYSDDLKHNLAFFSFKFVWIHPRIVLDYIQNGYLYKKTWHIKTKLTLMIIRHFVKTNKMVHTILLDSFHNVSETKLTSKVSTKSYPMQTFIWSFYQFYLQKPPSHQYISAEKRKIGICEPNNNQSFKS